MISSWLRRLANATLLAVSLVQIAPAIAVDSKLEDAIATQAEKLDWTIGNAILTIKRADGSLELTNSQIGLAGPEAQQFFEIANGHNEMQVDAVTLESTDDFATDENVSVRYYSYMPLGYVSVDDWDQLNVNTLFEEVVRNTKTANSKMKPGYPKIFIDDWIEEPQLNKRASTVYWALSGHNDEGQPFINARALILGKDGIVVQNWAGHPKLFSSSQKSLGPGTRAFRFDEGFSYADFQPGVDEVAAIGIGALVYKMISGKASAKVTGKAASAGLLALLVVFFKKAWFLLLAFPLLLWRWIKNRRDN